MDRREAMPMSGPPSFYIQRGISELHGQQQGVHSLSNTGMPFQSNVMGSSSGPALVLEPTLSALSSEGLGGGGSSFQPTVRRKRGRPRKYGPDGKVSLALSSRLHVPQGMNSSLAEKRGRGRPLGSGRKQHCPPFGELVSGSAGVGFTPHVITVAAGEDVSAKLLEFAQQGPRAVCILSANGSVSTVTLCQPSNSGGTITFEGRFDILCMSGSFLLVGNDSFRNRSGGLSISLASTDGRVIGGGVGGMLIAATPVQVIVGSFTWATSKTKPKNGKGTEVDANSELDRTMAAPPSTSMGNWGSPQPLNMRNSHVGIDLMRG